MEAGTVRHFFLRVCSHMFTQQCSYLAEDCAHTFLLRFASGFHMCVPAQVEMTLQLCMSCIVLYLGPDRDDLHVLHLIGVAGVFSHR